jgi:hypothetical protein
MDTYSILKNLLQSHIDGQIKLTANVIVFKKSRNHPKMSKDEVKYADREIQRMSEHVLKTEETIKEIMQLALEQLPRHKAIELNRWRIDYMKGPHVCAIHDFACCKDDYKF